MTRTFIQTKEFTRNWDDLGFNDDDLRRLELQIMSDPQIGAVMRGTGKLRKMRFALGNGGKSGGTRENLTSAERNDIKKMIIKLEQNLKMEV